MIHDIVTRKNEIFKRRLTLVTSHVLYICSDYSQYFDVLPITVDRDLSLFWSGAIELVDMVSCMCSTGANVISSLNTPSSAIISNIGMINWCGQASGML